MSLSERVIRAGNAQTEAPKTNLDLLEELRGRVQGHVSADKLARLAQSNPERARNEVRSACQRVFEEPDWAVRDPHTQQTLIDQLLDAIFGFGLLEGFLADDSITEIIANGPSKVFIERDGKLQLTDRAFADEEELRTLVDRILGPLGRRIDESSPMVDARLPQGHRVNVVVRPVGIDGPYLTIRKFSRHVITLDEMEQTGSIDHALHVFLVWAVRARRSIAVSGGTGSGKTTLLNALSCVISHDERIVTIEDSAELRFEQHPDVARLEARPPNAEGEGEITIRDLVRNSLRMRPDRIVVGECRGAEAIDMLQAMNTGHDGSMTTLHANSPAESVMRLTTMVRYASDLPIDVIESNIASAIHLVVQTQRGLDGARRISHVVSFRYDRDRGRCETEDIYRRAIDEDRGAWSSFPAWLQELPRLGVAGEGEVQEWMQSCRSSQ